MSSVRTFDVIAMPLAAAATPIHNGTPGQGFPPQLEGFVVQANGGDVHFGGAGVTGETNGFTIRRDESTNVLGFLSRGSPFAYDLTRIYYVGGPWKLVIERQI